MKQIHYTKSFWILFSILVFAIFSTQASTITSSSQGGLWNETTTWVGGVIPTQTDDVIINSVVTTGNVSYTTRTLKMNNLTVNTGGKILREASASGKYNLEIYGNLVNNGEIIDYINYFDINLYGNLENNGTLKPRIINLKGENQHISTNMAIECITFNFQMTDNEVIASSNLLFRNCDLPKNGTKQLNMGPFSLSLSNDSISHDSYYGKITNSSSISIPLKFDGTGTVVLDKAIIACPISGNVILDSPTFGFIKDMIVEGDVTIAEDAKISSYRDLQNLTINGNYTNYGKLNSDTINVSSLQLPPKRMKVFINGNASNDGNSGITEIYIYTNGETRLISGNYQGDVKLQQSDGSETPGGKVLISDEVNIFGRLEVYAALEIQEGATLNLLNRDWRRLYVRAEEGSITNHGNMSSYYYMNNDWGDRKYENQPWTSVDYEIWDWEGRIEGVDVAVFNGDTYPGLPGSVKRWWRLSPVGEGLPTQIILKFYYGDSILNGQKEENLHVFRSTDKGENWEVVSIGEHAVLDTVENSISIGKWSDADSMLDEFGDFVISSGDGTVPIPSPIIVNLTGSQDIRLGAPNRFSVHMENVGISRSRSFMAAVTVTDDIVFKQVEIPTNEGVEIIPIDSISTPQDHTELFFVPYLEPREEYSFDIIVLGANEGTKSATAAPSLTVVGLGNSAIDGEIEDYYVKKINEAADLDEHEADEYARGMGITVKQLEMKKQKDGRGVWAFKTTVKYAVEQASKTNPLTNVVFKIGNTIERVGKIKDSVRRRIWHWLYKEVGLYGVDEVKVISGKNVDGKIVTSWDPNEKLGPTGYGESNFITSAGKMNYTIKFENKKEATAAAYRVQVIDTLSAVFNQESVKFGTTSHSGEQYNWKMERTGNILKWDIEGIELPPNANPPEGEGYVSFSVDLIDGLESGVNIENDATIIFDVNEPITTNTWLNVLDTIAPSTTMNQINFSSGDTLLNVSCSAIDNENGSGINAYKFYASVDNGPFNFVGESFENSIPYSISDSTRHNFRFYAISTDNVDNQEKSVPIVSEVNTYLVSVDLINNFDNNIKLYPNPVNDKFTISFIVETQTKVELKLYDISGKLIKTTDIGMYNNGQHNVNSDISFLNSGVYLLEVNLNERSQKYKLVKK
ncbi:MAG: T9SS type A sorting domain-containing protein [Prolixibacteraceae bacterium]|nr:T9SS type A sorting domain-containing protein [Prolixibacteraceae bacterium]